MQKDPGQLHTPEKTTEMKGVTVVDKPTGVRKDLFRKATLNQSYFKITKYLIELFSA